MKDKNYDDEQYHNPDSLIRLIGEANGSEILVDDEECWALIDSIAQPSTITVSFAHKLGIPIHQLTKLFIVQQTVGGDVPYKEYVEV